MLGLCAAGLGGSAFVWFGKQALAVFREGIEHGTSYRAPGKPCKEVEF